MNDSLPIDFDASEEESNILIEDNGSKIKVEDSMDHDLHISTINKPSETANEMEEGELTSSKSLEIEAKKSETKTH